MGGSRRCGGERNGKYRDSTRDFWCSHPAGIGEFVTRFARVVAPSGSGEGNTLIGVMPGDSRETTMAINRPKTVLLDGTYEL